MSANTREAEPHGTGPDEDVTDLRFVLPAIDAPAEVEAGIVLQGLDAERLLAGLGLAALADDPALVTLAVDRIRHDANGALTTGHLLALGARRWRRTRGTIALVSGSAPPTGTPRRAWTQAARAVQAACEKEEPNGTLSPTCAAYLTACWIRRDEIDELAARSSAAI